MEQWQSLGKVTVFKNPSKSLIFHNIDINKRHNEGVTQLMFTCRKGHEEVVQLLNETFYGHFQTLCA